MVVELLDGIKTGLRLVPERPRLPAHIRSNTAFGVPRRRHDTRRRARIGVAGLGSFPSANHKSLSPLTFVIHSSRSTRLRPPFAFTCRGGHLLFPRYRTALLATKPDLDGGYTPRHAQPGPLKRKFSRSCVLLAGRHDRKGKPFVTSVRVTQRKRVGDL
jgi:hypothetical protein